jgi:hypothetical protein
MLRRKVNSIMKNPNVLEKMIRDEEQVEIKAWLDRIHVKDFMKRRQAIIELVRMAKKDPSMINVVREVIKRGKLHQEVDDMRARKLLNPDKYPVCFRCGKPIKEKHMLMFATSNGIVMMHTKCSTAKHNPISLYESFHGVAPIRKRKVFYNPPTGDLLSIGELSQINYKPTRGRYSNTEFYHKSGDTGEKILKTNLILATDKDGKNLYLLRKNNSKYPVFTDRGIIG